MIKDVEVELHDCGNTSLARELQDTTNRRLIAIDVYGVEREVIG